MIIGIDASRADKELKTGTEWYSFFLIEELKKITAGSEHKIILYSREPLHGELGEMPANWENKILRWPPKYLWTNIRLSFEMMTNPPDVLFIPAHSVPLIHAKNTVVTWHDIGFEKFKHLYSPQAYWYHKWTVRYSLKHAKKVIAISKFTKDEILKTFKIPEKKVAVVYNGYDTNKYNNPLDKDKIRQVWEKYKIKDPYIFFIGRLEEKKNIKGLVDSFVELKKMRLGVSGDSQTISNFKFQISKQFQNSNFQNLKLVLAGKRGYGYEKVKKIIKEHELENEIIELNWVPEEDKPYLLAGAEIFCFLSFYEGFGIPVLEAMACGTAVICSDIPPLREVAGNAALFVDLNKPQEIVGAMKKVLEDKNLREQMVKKGLDNVKMFSWEKCARDTWEVLTEI